MPSRRRLTVLNAPIPTVPHSSQRDNDLAIRPESSRPVSLSPRLAGGYVRRGRTTVYGHAGHRGGARRRPTRCRQRRLRRPGVGRTQAGRTRPTAPPGGPPHRGGLTLLGGHPSPRGEPRRRRRDATGPRRGADRSLAPSASRSGPHSTDANRAALGLFVMVITGCGWDFYRWTTYLPVDARPTLHGSPVACVHPF